MPAFTVVWTIDILDADSHDEAARLARRTQREDPNAAPYYTVLNTDTGEEQTIRLGDLPEEESA